MFCCMYYSSLVLERVKILGRLLMFTTLFCSCVSVSSVYEPCEIMGSSIVYSFP